VISVKNGCRFATEKLGLECGIGFEYIINFSRKTACKNIGSRLVPQVKALSKQVKHRKITVDENISYEYNTINKTLYQNKFCRTRRKF